MTTTLPTRPMANHLSTRDAARAMPTSTQGSTLADVLERVLDKGIVIAGDISVSVASTELLNIRIRLLISSVDKAREMGINWWENNPHYSSQNQELIEVNRQLQHRIEKLEAELHTLRLPAPVQEVPLPSPTPVAVAAPTPATDLSLESLLKDLQFPDGDVT